MNTEKRVKAFWMVEGYFKSEFGYKRGYLSRLFDNHQKAVNHANEMREAYSEHEYSHFVVIPIYYEEEHQ